MALHVDYASARAPTPSTRPAPTATRGSSHTAPLTLRFRVLLQGIKGQYLLLDTEVINLRKYSGYEIEFSAPEKIDELLQ
ncbi:DUF2797 domain-containing protein [Methyloglobulus sp.]|uniref:DUF2797 domain-containing protein n=1 Tax=Methyloglobulus sp. TaxID=2518622 RepID=UPI0032B7989C